ncbi:MAG: hypothetical protein ACK4RK_14485 [Gemmataceae bacterium]
MAEMIIRLHCDPVTGKKNITISLRSEEDALPHEHEQQHRELVEKLIHGGVLQAAEVGQIVVEREKTESETESLTTAEPTSERTAQAEPG